MSNVHGAMSKREVEAMQEHWGRGADGGRVLYHGTSFAALPHIAAAGLRPRDARGPSNWKRTIESNPETVYLTNSYALSFAENAVGEGDEIEQPCAIIEVDCENASVLAHLHADEDAIEQASRGRDHLPKGWGMVERTRYYRAITHRYPALPSLAALGTCGHRGAISPGAIKRVAVITSAKACELTFGGGIDPMITVLNYQVVGSDYRAFLKWVFDGGEEPWIRPSMREFAKHFSLPLIERKGIVVFESIENAVAAMRDATPCW